MLKKLLSLCLAVLFLVPVSAETFSYSGGSGRVSIVCDGVESREDGAYAAIRFVSNNHSKIAMSASERTSIIPMKTDSSSSRWCWGKIWRLWA